MKHIPRIINFNFVPLAERQICLPRIYFYLPGFNHNPGHLSWEFGRDWSLLNLTSFFYSGDKLPQESVDVSQLPTVPLENQLLRNQNGQTTEQIISSHNSLTNFSTLSHNEESRAEKYQNHGWKHKEYLGNKTLPNLNKVRVPLTIAQNTFDWYLSRKD